MRAIVLAGVAALAAGAGVATANPAYVFVGFGAAVAVLTVGVAVVRATPAPASLPIVAAPGRRPLAQRLVMLAIPGFIAVNAFDVRGYFLLGSGFARYALLVPVLAAMLFVLPTRRGPSVVPAADAGFALFTMLAVGGALVGFFVRHPVSSALPLALPACLAFSYLAIGPLLDDECGHILRGIEFAACAYVVMHLGAAVGLYSSGVNRSVGPVAFFSNGAFTHEKLPLLVMALHIIFRRRSKLAFAAVIAAIVVIYRDYPAGTYIAGLAVYLALLAVLKWRRKLVPLIFVGVLVAAAVAVVQVTKTDTQFGSAYFARVGKANNVSTRTILWDAAEHAIARKPVFGSYFSGEASVHVSAGNLPPLVPPHNDYLQIMLLGGAVALLLFAMKLISVGRSIGASLAQLDISADRRLLLETITAGVAMYLVVLTFNPVLLKLSLASLFFSLIGLVPSATRFAGGSGQAGAIDARFSATTDGG